MRIGILTLPLHTNYGGILQAFALQKILSDMGHEVTHIDLPHQYNMPKWKMVLLFPFRVIEKYILKNGKGVFREMAHDKEYPIISKFVEQFTLKYINRYETDKYPRVPKGLFDCIIVGSDQVWRHSYHRDIALVYLSYTKKWDIKRIGYAISFGLEKWTYSAKETQRCSCMAQMFDAISVREDSAIELCREYLGVHVQHVLDPTLLLSRACYQQIIDESKEPQSDGNLLVYILDSNEKKEKIVTALERQGNYKKFNVGSKCFEQNGTSAYERIQPSVESWLRGFADAELIVTDSFHGCVFSIIFKKPFLVLENKKRGSARIQSLLKMFNLEQCLYNESTGNINIPHIDYTIVDKLVQLKKKESLNFLIRNLQ